MSWFNSLLSGVSNTFSVRGRHVQIQKQSYEPVAALVCQNPFVGFDWSSYTG